MAIKKPFTQHEAVLLLDAYLKVSNGEITRTMAIKKCSELLRALAVNNGIDIESTYRNTNGIALQMSSMESACKGYTVVKPSTKMFRDTVKLYHTDKNQYELLLNEAMDMAGIKQNNETIGSPSQSLLFSQEKNKLSIDVSPFPMILKEYFNKGYRLGSTLDMKRFRRYYEEFTGTELSLDQEKLEAVIRGYGIVYDGKLYMPQTMLSSEMKDQLLTFIERCFEDGCASVYYEALFREFSEDLLDHNIFNSEMLKAYLTHYIGKKYYMGKTFLSKENGTGGAPIDEIRQCLKQYDVPVKVDEICGLLSHIEEDRIRSILGSNGEFVRNSKGEYFHADSLELTEEELEKIASIIESSLSEHNFISGNELYVAIQARYPYIFEKNAAFSAIGWRDALKYKYGNKFSFVGNIISRAGTSMSMGDVFTEYGKRISRFSLDELEQFAESIGSTIYFDSLYANTIRISHQWFTAKSEAHFSVDATDDVLDRFCNGEYMSLSTVSEFALFPEASFPWTEYLLEQYVAFFSEKFYLLHGNYNKNCAVGAIVRKTSGLESFDDLITDIIAYSDIPLQKKEVLDHLWKNGYIARRSYTNIESLIIRARAKRNQKEK